MKLATIALALLPFMASGQNIITIAGNGIIANTGDGGPATSAAIAAPGGLAFDGAGTVYFSGFTNHNMRKISPSGIISTIAGTGVAGFSGDGGPAIAAQLNNPTKICRDAAGNIFIADQLNNRIRKITAAGIISTYAGNGTAGYSGDGLAATNAAMHQPTGVCLDAAGNLYITDFFNSRVRKVSVAGIITTVVGTGVAGNSGDGGPATAAKIYTPFSVIFDAAGNMLLTDQYSATVRKVDPSGIISTIAGTGVPGYNGDGGPATAAKFNQPSSVAIDAGGNIFIEDFNNFRIRKISTAGIVTTVVGDGVAGFAGDGGPATAARLYYSNEIAFDNAGQLFINDNSNNRIRKLSAPCPAAITSQPLNDTVIAGATATYTVTTTAGSPTYQWQQNTGSGFTNLADIPPYSGATTNVLTISGAGSALNNTQYRCIIVSGTTACSETSDAAVLVVQAGCGPSISQQPLNDTVTVADTAIYTVVTGATMPYYQWQANTGSGFTNLTNASPYSGVTTPTLTVAPVLAAMNNTQYRCIITSMPDCSDTSVAAGLAVQSEGAVTVSGAQRFSVYPNPAHDQIIITLSGTANKAKVALINSVGQVVAQQAITANNTELNVSKLAAGIYIIKLEADGQVIYRKVVKQ